MVKSLRVFLSLVLALSMLGGGLTAMAEATAAPAAAAGADTPLVVTYDQFSEKFSPFFGESQMDVDASDMTQLYILTTDRVGAVVNHAIEGETRAYNGKDYTYTGAADVSVNYDDKADKTVYTIKLRKDLKFSDGVPLTADDVIFTYYVFCDPNYVGAVTVNSYNIVGLQNYRTQTSEDVYNKYQAIAEAIQKAGADYKAASSDSFTQEQYDSYWKTLKANWTAIDQAIVDYCMANYEDNIQDTVGFTPDEVKADDGLKIAFAMGLWGFGEVKDGVLTGGTTGKTWALKDAKPTMDDLYAETYAKYAGDADTFSTTESPDSNITPVGKATQEAFIKEWGPKDEGSKGGFPNIEGIKKLDDYTVEITTNGFEAPAIYNMIGIPIAPMHYYGDPAQYDYAANKFGFPFGDLSIVQAKSAQPMGAGPYKFIKYDNRVIYYEANDLYFKGAPKTKYVQFKETATNEVTAAVATGTADMGDMNGSKATFEEIRGYNTNKELTGDALVTERVDNLGYGYIGINAATVNVGGVPDSDASKSLRKALATILAVYRDVAVNSYYGDAASVINYPISNTSWAAPQPTDEGYQLAYSTGADGKPLYTADMAADQKYDAALKAAIEYFKAAGYTFDEAAGKFTAAPDGAKLSYEIIIPADGVGDHPSFAILTDAKAALAKIGIELKINDPSDSNVLWDALDANTHELWCAAWQATIDPDMYQTYHSSGIVGKGGSDSNHYSIADTTLDKLLVDARKSPDQSYRKEVYKQCLDIILDWAVEIPVYQRQNSTIYSPVRVDSQTFTPDITTFYKWQVEVSGIAMNAAK